MLTELELTKRLVSIRSDPGPDHEVMVIRYLAFLFKDTGLKLIHLDAGLGDGRNDLLVVNQDLDQVDLAGKLEPGLLLCGHVDVVPPGNEKEWLKDPFTPWIDEDNPDQLHGRGTTDMKGAVAAMIVAYLSCLDSIEEKKKEGKLVGLLFTVDEEVTLKGAEAFVGSNHARFFGGAVLGEPTSLIPVRGHKGVLFLKVRFKGKAAHGSVPGMGINAIKMAMEFYARMEKEFNDMKRMNTHPILGEPTINLGVIAGGVAANIVPDSCELNIDIRTTSYEMQGEVLSTIEHLIDSMDFPADASAWVDVMNEKKPFYLDDASPFLKKMVELTGVPAQIMNGYTEAGVYFNESGLSTVIIGPGSINQAHVVNEYISIKELGKSVEIYKKIILSYLNSSGQFF
ncbi:MAG: M20 family metallopeptidase [Promethearchaeota archaeon]